MKIPMIFDVSEDDKIVFNKFIKEKRSDCIRSSQIIVDEIFSKNDFLKNDLKYKKNVSQLISNLRKEVWNEFLTDEINFNAEVMKKLHTVLDLPKQVLTILINKKISDSSDDNLNHNIKELCGEYAGRVFPYLYHLSLSNTQSRRSRAGKTFEAIIYKIYDLLDYPYDSQGRVGRKIFDDVGLGKKVDSILPSIDNFKTIRNKTIIWTMKTTLRERWQEVAEEI